MGKEKIIKAMYDPSIGVKDLLEQQSEKMKIYNWKSHWKGSNRNYQRLMDYMQEEIGWQDYGHAFSFLRDYNEEYDNFGEYLINRGYKFFMDGTSVKQILQINQVVKCIGKITTVDYYRMFTYNYGEEGNMKKWGQKEPLE